MKNESDNAASINSAKQTQPQQGTGFTPEQVQALESYFQEYDFTKEPSPEVLPFVDSDFGGLRPTFLDVARGKYPNIEDLARKHMIDFTNSRVAKGLLLKLFIANLPVEADRPQVVRALNLGAKRFQLMIPKDPNNPNKNRGFAFLVVKPDDGGPLLNTPVKVNENLLRITPAMTGRS